MGNVSIIVNLDFKYNHPNDLLRSNRCQRSLRRGIFDYAVPESLAGKVGVGHLVIVPFGKQTVQGVVFRFIDQPSVQEVKEIVELVDPEPVLTQAQIALAEAMAESTLSPLAAVVGLFLPVGLSQQVDTIYEITMKQRCRD